MSAIQVGQGRRYLEGLPRTGGLVDNIGIPQHLQTLSNCVIVEISVSARKLRCADFLSKSDPVCILSEQEGGNKWKEVGMTEVIMNNCNPEFVKMFYVSKDTEKTKQLKFQLYDVDSQDRPYITEANFLGQFQCSIQRLVGLLTLEEELKSQSDGKFKGQITVVAEVESQGKEHKENLNFTIKVTDVRGTKLYIRISKQNENRFIPFHRTEAVSHYKGTAEWDLSIDRLSACNYNDSRKIRFECFEDKNGGDKCLGEFKIPMERLKRLKDTDKIEFAGQKDGTKPMMATIKNMSTNRNLNFMDHVKNGMKIMVTLALDFTVSNKKYHKRLPNSESSSEISSSLYGRAMTMVCHGLSDTFQSKMKLFACGLGALLPQADRVSEICPLHGKKTSDEYESIEDVIDHYHQTLEQITLSGPTNFAEVIQHVCRKAEKVSLKKEEYHILVLFTDGGIDDTAQTKEAIASASKLPVSIVIIGIGDGSFEAMKMLDSDQKILRRSDCGQAIRDIVQFVEFKKYDAQQHSGPLDIDSDSLKNEVLQEIPGQFNSYSRGQDMPPPENMMGSLKF